MATCSLASSGSSFRPHNLEDSRNRCARPYQRTKPKRYISNISQNSASTPSFDDPIICINISGCRYETRLSTLNRFPDTLLGNPHKRMVYFDFMRNEFFFERNRKLFGGVLEYYQTGGIIRKPENIPLDVFLEELAFFEIHRDIIKKFLGDEDDDEIPAILPDDNFQRKCWLILERPNSSKIAHVLASFNILIILLAVVNYSVETLPEFRYYQNYLTDEKDIKKTLISNPFFVIESICNFWFCLELLLRFIVSPEKKQFFLRLINIVDCFSIMPYFVDIILHFKTYNRKGGFLVAIQALRVFRLLRIFRIFKLTRYSDGLNILWLTMKSARNELGVLCLLFGIGMTICSATIYYAEHGYEDSDFHDIPGAFWWTVITWATVGYGDMVPKHPLGKIVGGICSTTGVVCLAFVVPIIVSHFEYFFHRKGPAPLDDNSDDQ